MDFRLRLFHQLLRLRRVEEAIAAAYGEQEMRCPVHLGIGQEAVSVGVCAALRPGDAVMGTHRSHLPYLAKGGDLKAMMAELYGRADGCCSGWGGSMHLLDMEAGVAGCTPIVGGSIPVAAGLAFAAVLQGLDRVVAVFFGEGATEEGVFVETLNFAALKSLPVLFVCENNLYSVYSPLEVRQAPARDRLALARAHGMPAAHDDGNDAEAVLLSAQEAAERARRGEGPTYLEFDTYRWLEHCGPHNDDHIGYRSLEEAEAWRGRCPVDRMRRQLEEAGLLDETILQEAEVRIQAEIQEAFAFAQASPFPDPGVFHALIQPGEVTL